MSSVTETTAPPEVGAPPARAAWFAWIQTFPDRNNPDRTGGSTSARGDTFPAFLADIFRTGSYYLGLGYRVRVQSAELACTHCHGNGTIRQGKRVVKSVRCPSCKGRAVYARIPDFDLRPAEGVTVWSDALGDFPGPDPYDRMRQINGLD